MSTTIHPPANAPVTQGPEPSSAPADGGYATSAGKTSSGRVRRYAKRTAIAVAVTVAIVSVVVAYSARQTEADIQALRDRVEVIGLANPSPVYNADAPGDVPEPVRRYFDYTFVGAGGPLGFVEMTMDGDFRRPLTEGFSPTTAEQTIAVGTPSLMFSARTSMFPGVWARAYDFYANGEMEMKAKVMSTLTVVDESETPELNQTSLQRWLLESPMYPAALLPGGPVRWEPIDDSHAEQW